MDLAQLLTHSPELVLITIPIAAIFSGTVMGVLRHRERMAMIEHGMDPDAVKKARMLARHEEVPRLERR
jgi:hypothetical protein